MDDSEEERILEALTFDQIKEIAEEGVDPNLPTKEKRQLYADNFEEFMEDSDVYSRHLYQILGQKLLDEITRSFEHRKNTDPPESKIHKYNKIDDYIDDRDSERENLYINEEAELLFASLADAVKAFEENPQNNRSNYYMRSPTPRWNSRGKPIKRKTKRRPQRLPRSWLSRGGSKSKPHKSKRNKSQRGEKNKKKKSLKKKH